MKVSSFFYTFFTYFLRPFFSFFSFPMKVSSFFYAFFTYFLRFLRLFFSFFLSNENVKLFLTHFLRTFYAFYALSSLFSFPMKVSSLFYAFFTYFLRFLRPFLSFADVTFADVTPERSQKEERVRRCDICGETGAKRLWHHYRYVGGERVPTAGMQSWKKNLTVHWKGKKEKKRCKKRKKYVKNA